MNNDSILIDKSINTTKQNHPKLQVFRDREGMICIGGAILLFTLLYFQKKLH